MTPIDPAEISALVDGELAPARAKQVREAILTDASLRRVYGELVALDTDLKRAATGAVFQPPVVLPVASGRPGLRIFVTAAVLVLLRVAMKLAPPELAVGLAAGLLAMVIGLVVRSLAAGPAAAFPAARGMD